MKKIISLIAGITIILTAVIVGYPTSYSQEGLPYPNVGELPDPPACLQVVENRIHLMREAWTANLEAMKDQEKPTSAKVDEAFESLRSYNCWLDYLCDVVFYSGSTNEEEAEGGITPADIRTRGRCAPIDQLDSTIAEHLTYIPECSVSDDDPIQLAKIVDNSLNRCRDLVNLEFAQFDQVTPEEQGSRADALRQDSSNAFITVERALRADSASQKNQALQKKFSSLINKMHAMEGHMNLLKTQFMSFDNLLPCLAMDCD